MPLVDLPLKSLETYRGMNPRPKDFDAYWAAALSELDAVDPDVQLEPAGFGAGVAQCSHLWFTGVGGARIHAKHARPVGETSTPRAAVLRFHGYSGASGDWIELLPWTAAGLEIATMDCRGQGGLSEDPGGVRGTTHCGQIVRGLDDPDPRRLLFRQIFLDTVQLARVVMAFDTVDAGRIGACGGSQGGGLTLACAALEPRIRRAAPRFPFLCDYQRVWEMDLAKDAYNELTTFFRHHDPRHEREEEIFTRLGYIDVQHLAERIQAEVLMGVGLMDSICPPSTQFAAFNKIRGPKRTLTYPDFRHESLPGWEDAAFEFLLGM